jgi:HEAT repeat protein
MPISSENRLVLTLALRNPETVLAAIEALRHDTSKTGVDGLIELLYPPHAARPAVAAITVLEGRAEAIIDDALLAALVSPHSSVRLVAVQALHRRRANAGEPLRCLLDEDESWLVRRAALLALADSPARWNILDAATDPHWRVRHTLVRVLLDWDDRHEIDQRLGSLKTSSRIEGLRAYLQYRWTGKTPGTFPAPIDPTSLCPFWDWDVFVLARDLERLGPDGREEAIVYMPYLLSHPEERVRALAIDTLSSCGTATHLAAAVAQPDEPRNGTISSVARLFSLIDGDRIEETAELILQLPAPSAAQLAWARSHVEEDYKISTGHPDEELLPATLQDDPHPHVRAAAMTPERAAELIAQPERETSWHVLARAAHLMKVPLWKIEPEEKWKPKQLPASIREALHPQRRAQPPVRQLGPDALKVVPLGISGHYGLPIEGFVRAFEAGVNLMFWEPNYQSLTEFAGRLSLSDRESIHFIAGTFEADGKRVRRDVERALRQLQLNQLSIFLIFWVQNWRRITPDVLESLERLKEEGSIASFGLSTHSRPLALTALETGWNPVMVRHSAAHRGAEQEIFAKAVEKGVGLITFNNTCYGRLLQPQPGLPTPSAADCYRYTLEQPGVSACLSAPATVEELEHNLGVLMQPELPSERRAKVLAQGERVYQEDTIFRKLVRAL